MRKYLTTFFCFICACLSHADDADGRVLGVGSATIDLLIQVDEGFLTEYTASKKGGSLYGETDRISQIISASGKEAKVVPGGSTANTLRALAQLGEKCAFFDCVGEDSYGELFCRDLSENAIEGRLIKLEGISTAHVLCMISEGGQRTFLACDPLLDDIVPTEKDFEGIQWLHIDARKFGCGSAVMKTLQMARRLNVKVSLSLSCSEIIQKYRSQIEEALSQYVDIVFCNEDEALEFTGLSPEEGCLKFLDYCPIAVVTTGAQGCVVGYDHQVISVPGIPAQVIDTTGAGDYFAAGFLYGYLHGKSMEVSARIGHTLGSAIVEVIGAQLPEARWKLVRDRVAEIEGI